MPKSEVETAVKNAVTKSRNGNIVLTTQLENQIYNGIMAAGGGGGGEIPELQDMKGILPVEKGGTSSTDAPSARAALGAAADDEVVKLTGNQTIEGVKTLKRFLLLQLDAEKGTNPTNTITKQIIMSDKNGTAGSGNRTSIAAFYGGVHDSGEAYADMRAFKFVAGSEDKAVLSVHCLKDGTKFAKAPTPAATASGQEIVTAEWVKANLTDNAVLLTGDQTVNGQKVFTQEFVFRDGRLTKGTLPPRIMRTGSYTVDKNWSRNDSGFINVASSLQTSVDTLGTNTVTLSAYQWQANSENTAAITLVCTADGQTKYATAPTPAGTASGNEIVTAEWFRSNTVMLTGAQSISGEKTFTDNVKISRPNPTGGTTNAAGLDFVSNELVRGENPSRNCSGEVRFWSKNKAQLMGKMQAEVQTNGTSAIYLEAWENAVGGDAAKAELMYPLNGNPVFKIPTPPAGVTGQEAVTAEWVQANAMRPGLTLKNLAGRGIPGGNLWGALQWDNTPTYNAGGKLSKYGNSIICNAAGWVRVCGGFITQATASAQTVKIGLRQLRDGGTYIMTYNDKKIEQILAAGDAAYLTWEGLLYVQQGDELTLGAVVQNYLLVESGVFSVEYLGG